MGANKVLGMVAFLIRELRLLVERLIVLALLLQ
jgi:hypothetical protein